MDRSKKRSTFLVNEKFQWKYTRYLATTAFLATLLAGGTTAYFLNENYSLFNRLAFLHAPELLPQLEREQIWINTYLFGFVIAMLTFSILFGLKMTSRIAGPLMVLKMHVRNLARGLFSQKPLRVRETDEFRDLIETYNYYYQSQQAQLRKDIKKLSAIKKSHDPKKMNDALSELLEEKQSQLNETVSSPQPTSGSRHAS